MPSPEESSPFKPRYFALCIVLSVFLDATSATPLLYASGRLLTVALIALVFVLPANQGIYPLVFLLLASPDLTQSDVDVAARGDLASATIWQLGVGPLRGATLVTAILAAYTLRLRRAHLQRIDWIFILYFGAVVFAVSVAYGFLPGDWSVIITDVRFPAFFLLGIVLFEWYRATFPTETDRLVKVLAVIVFSRFVLDLAYLALNVERTVISDVNRVSVDSTKGLVVLPAFFGLYLLLATKARLKGAALFIAFSVLLIAYQTRFLVLMYLLGILVMLWLARRVAGAWMLLVIPIALATLLLGLSVAFPSVMATAMSRLRPVFLLGTQGQFDVVDYVRYRSVVNAVGTLYEARAFLTGLGYGSWFTDAHAPFGLLEEASLNIDMIRSGQFVRIHDFFFHVLFKFGLIGVVLYSAQFLIPAFRAWKVREMLLSPMKKAVVYSVCAGLPAIITTCYWASKGVLASAAAVAVLRICANIPARPAHLSDHELRQGV